MERNWSVVVWRKERLVKHGDKNEISGKGYLLPKSRTVPTWLERPTVNLIISAQAILVWALAEALKDPGWPQQGDESVTEREERRYGWDHLERGGEAGVCLLEPGAVARTSCWVAAVVEPSQE